MVTKTDSLGSVILLAVLINLYNFAFCSNDLSDYLLLMNILKFLPYLYEMSGSFLKREAISGLS